MATSDERTAAPAQRRPAAGEAGSGGARGPEQRRGGAAAGAARRPTIEDVARLAGVSRGTVSRVINGGRNVRPAVLDTVNAAIDALGYSVNQAARNLARGRTGSIAFVISDREERLFEDPNFGLFVRVFSRQLRANGRHLLMTTAQDEEEENFLGDYLTLGHVDGALLALTHERGAAARAAAVEPAAAGRARQAARLRGRVLLGGDRRREGGVHRRELPGRQGRRRRSGP